MAPHVWTTVLLSLGLGLGIAAQLTPWATQEIPPSEQCTPFGGQCFDVPGSKWSFEAWELRVRSDGSSQSADWADNDLDDEPGADEMRAVGPLLVVGVVLAAVAIPLIWIGWFQHVGFSIGGIVAAGVAGTFVLIAGILAWVGLSDISSEIEAAGGDGAVPHVGGFLALAAMLAAFAGTGTAIVDTLRGQPLETSRLTARPDAAVVQLACPRCNERFSARAGGMARCPACRFSGPTPV